MTGESRRLFQRGGAALWERLRVAPSKQESFHSIHRHHGPTPPGTPPAGRMKTKHTGIRWSAGV